MMKKILCFFVIGSLLMACESKTSLKDQKTASSTDESGKEIVNPNVVVTGKIQNASNKKISLYAGSRNGSVFVSETKTNEDGFFKLRGAIDELGLYQLVMDSSFTSDGRVKSVPLTLVPKDSVNLALTNDDSFGYSVKYSGTKWAKSLNEYMQKLKPFIDWQKTLKIEQQMNRDSLTRVALERKKPIDKYVINLINTDPTNPANVLLLTNLLPNFGFQYYDSSYFAPLEKLHKAFEKAYPNLLLTKSLTKQIPLLLKQYQSYKLYNIDKIAPEIALPNPQGDTLRLSSLRGKYVLIDFWASWCRPCRNENPNVVKMYKKYHDAGFEVFSVSLDENKEDWVKAIKQDGLVWNNHVSELNKWKSEVAQEYGVSSIPHSILIDPKGKIIAEDLRGPTLENALKGIFKR